MGITNIGFGAFGTFQSDYRINSIPKAEIAAKQVQKTDENNRLNDKTKVETSSQSEVAKSNKSYEILPVDNRPLATDPNSVSLNFNKGDDFSYIGSEKDIAKLDMQKAISDMKQDNILQEYNYFIGSSRNVYSSEDGVVLAK